MTAAPQGSPPPVAIVSSNYWPERTGISQTTTELAEFLAARGLRVRVACAMPYYPEWQIAPAYRGRLWLREVHQGVEIRRAWHYVSPRVSTASRLLHEVTLAACSIPSILATIAGARTVVVVSPDLSYAWLALMLAALLRRRRVLLVQDVMPDAAVELGMLRNPVVIGATRWLARSAYRLAHEVLTIGEGMRRRIARVAGADRPIRLLPNTIDGEELAPVAPAENAFRARFVPEGAFAVLHTGNMGKKQDLDLLLRAAAQLRDDAGVRFLVFGDGAERAAFLERRDRQGLARVEHHPLQERWLLRHMLSGADVVLVSQLPEVVDIVVPSKLLTAMAAGAMIVVAAAPDSEAARLVRESGGGVVIDAGDEAALVDVIARLRDGRLDPAPLRRAARAYALRTFDRAAVYGPLAEALGAAPAPAAA